jgi:L-malate glycosyltransferase
MAIHQVLVSAAPGDAITNMAFEIRSLLRRIGPSDLFARFIDTQLQQEVLPLDAYAERVPARGRGDILIYHASIGQAEVAAFLLERPEELVLLYHNITPPEFYLPYDSTFSRLLAEGRFELGLLRPRVVLALAVSSYNAQELEDLGYRDVRVSPPIFDVQGLTKGEPYGPKVRDLAQEPDLPFILFVGQLLPHKRPDLLLQAYSVLVTHLMPDARLALVGALRQPTYERALRSFLRESNLPNAWLCGTVSTAELIAFFRRADLFVTASEHEGFCIPLVEAMAFGVPVVARSYAAIPETMGSGGLLLPPNSGPLMLAEAMAAVIEDTALARELAVRGTARAREFDVNSARQAFLGHLAAVT